MSESVENIELNKFYQSLMQDLRSTQISEEEGGTLEQIFTQVAVDLLADTGETENVRIAYDEGQLGTKNQHKINAYGEPDNYETIDLFITIFKGTDEPQRIPKDEIDTASKRISNFYRKAKFKNYVNEIEESSPIWDFAHTLSDSKQLSENLVRINAIILTDGYYLSDVPKNDVISNCPIYYRVVDISYLYNISEKSHIPIEINFEEEGFHIPCIISPSENDQYQSYLAIMPGTALATIYERFGSRLLEQNVRSFLQFTGKVNKGIRKTILEEPQMFLAFNNGIAATAEELDLAASKDGKGIIISKVKDFQIVNGGQTTASIYHTFKKDKANLGDIFIQVKLTIVKNKNKFSEIVSRIAEYANTQNKVSAADLSSNNPYHVQLEKLSRNIFAPHTHGQTNQTKWFYERARGQYRNAMLREGFTKAKKKAFELKNPKSQVFTKEDLAKYINSTQEVYLGKKLVIGPHFVVRGNQKNHVEFIKHNLIDKPDNIYFEDSIAKAILFKKTEKIYGVKPNAIGDMRYVTVPYSIAYISFKTKNQIDYYKIWRNQDISEKLRSVLYDLMCKVEKYIKTIAPGSLYGEWAKKEECWNLIKQQDFGINLIRELKEDLISPNSTIIRRKLDEDETQQIEAENQIAKLKEIPAKIWDNIAEWGRETQSLSNQEITLALYISPVLKKKTDIDKKTREDAITLLHKVIENAPKLLQEIEEINKQTKVIDIAKKLIKWNDVHQKLSKDEVMFLSQVLNGKMKLTEKAEQIIIAILNNVKEIMRDNDY